MIQPTNYWGHARQDVLRYAEKIPSELDAANLRAFVKILDNATKFMLPDEGALFDRTKVVHFSEDQLETVNLPYEAVLVEFPVTYSHGKNFDPGYATTSSKRVALACTIRHFLRMGGRFPVELDPEGYEDAILVAAIYWVDRMKMWITSPVGLVICREIDPGASEILNPRECYTNLRLRPIPLLEEPVKVAMANGLSLDKVLEDGLYDVRSETVAVIDLLHIFQCSNVRTTAIGGAGEAVNRRRVAAGKVPLYEYRVLTVDIGGVKYRASDERPDGYDSGRNSPRQHLRRGHIRVCHSGVKVWVQPCVVGGGANGVIDKDYAIGF